MFVVLVNGKKERFTAQDYVIPAENCALVGDH